MGQLRFLHWYSFWASGSASFGMAHTVQYTASKIRLQNDCQVTQNISISAAANLILLFEINFLACFWEIRGELIIAGTMVWSKIYS